MSAYGAPCLSTFYAVSSGLIASPFTSTSVSSTLEVPFLMGVSGSAFFFPRAFFEGVPSMLSFFPRERFARVAGVAGLPEAPTVAATAEEVSRADFLIFAKRWLLYGQHIVIARVSLPRVR